MMKQWMIAGLMGATVLSGVAPSAAAAAEQDRTEGRWNDWRNRARQPEAARERGEPRPGWRENQVQARQERAEAVRNARQDRVEAAREARQVRVEAVRQDGRDWRQAAQEDRRERRQDNRQDGRDWRRDRIEDRRNWSQDRREDRNDWRRDRIEDRRDRVEDRRDDRRDWRDNRRWDYRNADRRYSWDRDWRRDQRYDWQRYRQTHRHIYRGPHYYAPRGWDYGYRRFSIGIALWSGLYADRYWISDPWYYRLPPAYGPLRWVRYYDDALLVDIRTGYVVDVIHDFFW